jgi:hypothetical protein
MAMPFLRMIVSGNLNPVGRRHADRRARCTTSVYPELSQLRKTSQPEALRPREGFAYVGKHLGTGYTQLTPGKLSVSLACTIVCRER